VPDSAKFWDKRADKYSKSPVKDQENYDRTLDCTRKHLSASDQALEVGCETGTTALLLAPSVKQITARGLPLCAIWWSRMARHIYRPPETNGRGNAGHPRADAVVSARTRCMQRRQCDTRAQFPRPEAPPRQLVPGT
jgi:hypothetical protein